jgi:uncharacterized protein YlxW (UPF0749 family)
MTTPPDPPVPASSVRRPPPSSYLSDLLTDTLDPGYAAAAERRTAGPGGRSRRARIGAVAICAVIGLIVAVAYQYTRDHAPDTARARRALIGKVRAAQASAGKLAAQANGLAGQVSAARQGAGRRPSGADLTRAEELAGSVAVRGPGLRVTLGNPASGSRRLIDLDVRAVVNQLWLAGAEAITVNDVRLTPTSAIRFAGSAVLVDFQPLSAPYVVRAIGAPDQLDTRFTVSDVASKYRTLASAFGFTFTVNQSTDLRLPAAATHRNRYARPSQFSSAPETAPIRRNRPL